MRYLTILFTFLFISCSTTPTTPTPSVTGAWGYTETVDVEGTPVVAGIQFIISSNNTYSLSATAAAGATSTILHRETGTWNMSGNSVTLTPSSCQDFDFVNNMLAESECGNSKILVFNGDTMTDGTITVSRK